MFGSNSIYMCVKTNRDRIKYGLTWKTTAFIFQIRPDFIYLERGTKKKNLFEYDISDPYLKNLGLHAKFNAEYKI